jgi:putative acetyltransferase
MNPGRLIIAVDDPAAADVRTLLELHLAWSNDVTPSGHVHALDVAGLAGPDIIFCSARIDGVLLGVGALRRLDDEHAELKSMHTTEAARGQGVGRATVEHLMGLAGANGHRRVSLETGTMDAFAPARRLYTSLGFRPCPPFAGYTDNPYSVCMTRAVSPWNGSSG